MGTIFIIVANAGFHSRAIGWSTSFKAADEWLKSEKGTGDSACGEYTCGDGVIYSISEVPACCDDGTECVVVGRVNDITRAFGPFDDEKLAKTHLNEQGYTAPGGKHFGAGTGNTSTLFEVVKVEPAVALTPRM